MTAIEHPEPPVRHEPSIVRAEVGCKATCSCGWSAVAPSEPRAALAFLEHRRAS